MEASSFMLTQGLGHFPARLIGPDENVLAYGNAGLDLDAHTVTFRGDFVPLYPLGTALCVERMDRGTPVHRFAGRVFLSDKQLIRLTGLKDTLLPGSERIYCGGYPYFAEVRLVSRKRGFFGEKCIPAPLISRVAMPELTDEQFVLLYDTAETLVPGQLLLVKPELPVELPEQSAELVRSGIFAAAQPRLCRFTDMKETDRKKLREFLAAYNQKHHKLF